MSSLASKNLYELLGNDPDQDPDLRVEPPPVQPVDKTAPRVGKRNATGEAPAAAAEPATERGGDRGGRGRGRGGRGRGRGGNEAVMFDAEAGRNRNRERPTEDGVAGEDRPPRRNRGEGGFRGEGRRGGRGGRGGRAVQDDRHSHTVHSGPDDGAKQAEKGWGADTATGELADEQAGEAIAWADEMKAGDKWDQDAPQGADDKQWSSEAAPGAADQPEPEPEDKSKSYADYLAEQAEKKAQLGGALPVRKPNEGSKDQPEGKAVARVQEDYFGGAAQKARKEKERKDRNLLTLDHDIQAREQPSTRGGGRGRGGRGRGDRPEGGFRGDGPREGRGGRGGRGRGDRGDGPREPRGDRGGPRGPGPRSGGDAAINVTSATDFPGLG